MSVEEAEVEVQRACGVCVATRVARAVAKCAQVVWKGCGPGREDTKVIEIERDVIRRDVTAFASNAHSITFWWWCDTILSEYVYSVKSVMLTQN